MAPLSTKFSNLLVVALAVPAILLALDADFTVTAAPLNRRSAFLAEDSVLEARAIKGPTGGRGGQKHSSGGRGGRSGHGGHSGARVHVGATLNVGSNNGGESSETSQQLLMRDIDEPSTQEPARGPDAVVSHHFHGHHSHGTTKRPRHEPHGGNQHPHAHPQNGGKGSHREHHGKGPNSGQGHRHSQSGSADTEAGAPTDATAAQLRRRAVSQPLGSGKESLGSTNLAQTVPPAEPQAIGQGVGAHATPKKPIVPAEHQDIGQGAGAHTPQKHHRKPTGGPRRHHVLLAGHRSHPTKQHHERPGHDEHHELLEHEHEHEHEHPQRPLNTANKLQHPHADTESYPLAGGQRAKLNAGAPTEHRDPQHPLNTANKLQHPHADTESYPGGLKAATNADVPNVHPRSFYYDLEDLD